METKEKIQNLINENNVVLFMNFNEEMIVAGTNNFFNFFALGAPGYSQLKFNLLNAGISGTFSREFNIASSLVYSHTNSIDNTQVR